MASSHVGDGARLGRGGDGSTPGHQARLDSYVPTFDNQQKNYREFRKRCELYRRKMQMGKREAETVFNIVTLLSGKAWDLVEDFSVEQLAAENAFEAVFARLDGGFRYDPLTELPDDFETFFIKLQRKGGQTLQDYVTDFTKAERRLKISHQVDLPEKVKAWWFLRRSGITKEQRQMILTNVGVAGLAMDTVTKAMSFILGQDSRAESSNRFGKVYGKTEAYYHRDDDDGYDWMAPDPTDSQIPIYYEHEDDRLEDPWLDDGQDYYHQDDAVVNYMSEPIYDVDEYDEVYATYHDAKAKLNAMRVSRGFYPVVVALVGTKGDGRAKGSSETSKKGKTKGKAKAGKGKSPNPKGRAASAGVGKTLCLRCGQPGHWARNCPQASSSDKKRKIENSDEINMVMDEMPDNCYNLDTDDGDYDSDDRAVQDGGAASVLGSAKQIRKYLRYLLERGFDLNQIKVFNCIKTFSYGNSQKETTNRCLYLPTFFGGKRIDVLTYVIKGEAPLLFGRPLLEELGLVMDYGDKKMKWPGMEWEMVETGPRGEHLLRLGRDLEQCKNEEPAMILTPKDFADHVKGELSIGDLMSDDTELVLASEEYLEVPHDPATAEPEQHTPCQGGTVDEAVKDPVKRLHPNKLRKMIAQTEHAVNRMTKELELGQVLVASDDLNKRRVIWEIFVGAGRTTEALQHYKNVEVEIFSLQTGWDFEKASHRSQLMKRLRAEKPDELMLAPMCRLWSPLQELNVAQSDEYRLKLIQDRKENHDTILMMCSAVFREQQRCGREATLEHPWNSRAWSTRALCMLEENTFDCYVDQCMYGMTVPTQDGQELPVRKPTCFRTTKESLAAGLSVECDGSHGHLPLEGSYRGVSRSKMAENYPEDLAQQLAYLLQQPSAKADAILPADDDPEEDADREHDPVFKNMKLQREVGAQVMQYIRRLHKNLGHPAPDVLHRMLTEIQATEAVLKAAKEYECIHCHERKGPSGVPPAAGLTARSFGERLMADTAWIDTDNGRCCIMTLMDQATRYVCLRVMNDEKSTSLVKGIERSWIKHFGTPRYLRIDEGKGFAATYLRDWCSERGIMLEIAPAESHNWLGSVERKHQVVRKALELYMEERGSRSIKMLAEAAIYCPGQINSLSYTKGFTPAQWVLGKAPYDVLSLTADIFNPGMSLSKDTPNFEEVQKRRLAAQMAFLKADSDARLRRAMNQNYRQNKLDVVVGQRCFYWRIQGTGKLQKNKWRGPARCVAEERDDNGKQLVLWLCHGTSLLRCSPQQVRPAVEDIGKELPIDAKAALKDLKDIRARSTTQFKDVMELGAGEVVLEDLMDEDELEGYEPSVDEGDPRDPNEISEGAGALAFQSMREETVPETPYHHSDDGEAGAIREEQMVEPDAEADTERKRMPSKAAGTPDSSPKGKKAKTVEAIPVPEVMENELLVEDAFMIEIKDQQLPPDWVLIEGGFELDEVYLAQLRGGEVNEKNMTREERELMIEAKVKELTSYFNNKVWDFVEMSKVRPERVVTARWVLTWKKEEETGKVKAKARLVLKGFQDPDLLSMEKTAPTASKNSKMLMLSLAPNMGWTILCGDVRAAFLSGSTFDREIIVKVPRDCGPLMGMPSGDSYMRMNKSAYGLCDAPLLWWQEADRRLRVLKMHRHRLDKCCYMLYNSSGKLIVMLILHVDDMLVGVEKGDPMVTTFIVELKKLFDFGKWQELQIGKPIHYCGGRVSLRDDGAIVLDFEEYLKKVMPITIGKGRDPEDKMTSAEISKARGLLGALQWPATQACPHLNASVSLLAADIRDGKVKVMLELNKTLRFAKHAVDFKVVMQKVFSGLEDMCYVVYSDAAFGVRSDGSSQGGYIVILTSLKALAGETVAYNIVGWRSFKLTRVCRSSLSAESQGCSGALDELMMIKTFTALLMDPSIDPKDEATASRGASALVIDAKGLYDALQKDCIGSGADKRAAIDILCSKEEIARLKTSLRWVSSERMLADGLTKQHTRQSFVDMLKSGMMKLVEDKDFVAAKKKNKNERAVSTARTFGSRVAEKIAFVVMNTEVARAAAAKGEEEHVDWILCGLVGLLVMNLIYMICRGASFVFTLGQKSFVHMSMSAAVSNAATQTDDVGAQSRADAGALREDLACYFCTHGQCWHLDGDCPTLRQSRVFRKEKLCHHCYDRRIKKQR